MNITSSTSINISSSNGISSYNNLYNPQKNFDLKATEDKEIKDLEYMQKVEKVREEVLMNEEEMKNFFYMLSGIKIEEKKVMDLFA